MFISIACMVITIAALIWLVRFYRRLDQELKAMENQTNPKKETPNA